MTTITVCTTCRMPERRKEPAGAPDGAAFLAHIATLAPEGVSVRGAACLMGCAQGCNVAIAAHGKLTYVLGRFDGTRRDAEAIAAYAALYAQSAVGQVPFRQWPQGVTGHFIARIPPLDETS
ncbi:MAG: DUF1636 domain-containing protein [Pseudomonadota bacterium]